MHSDEVFKGRLLSRREMVALLGSAGAALLVACSGDSDDANATPGATSAAANPSQSEGASPTAMAAGAAGATGSTGAAATSTAMPSCVVIPELTEGPYFVDERLERADIRSDTDSGEVREGAPLVLTLNVLAVSGGACTPLAGAMVDVWHCDAVGAYSGVTDNTEGFATEDENFLRGFLNTNGDGRVEFTTIYPGWYTGRATHIHFKVRQDNLEFTSQVFFDDALSDQVHGSGGAYAEKGVSGRQQNSQDGIYQQSNGMLLLDVQPSGDGYAATFDIGLQV